jgi:hypothetical protein
LIQDRPVAKANTNHGTFPANHESTAHLFGVKDGFQNWSSIPVSDSRSPVNEGLDKRRFDRRLFMAAAITFPLIVLAGFGRTYYIGGLFDAPPLASMLVHLHGLLMSVWVVLFVTQVRFISSRRPWPEYPSRLCRLSVPSGSSAFPPRWHCCASDWTRGTTVG